MTEVNRITFEDLEKAGYMFHSSLDWMTATYMNATGRILLVEGNCDTVSDQGTGDNVKDVKDL